MINKQLSLFCLLFLACGSGPGKAEVQPPQPVEQPQEERCGFFATQASEVWSFDRHEDINLESKIFHGRLEANEAEQVVGQLDNFSLTWVMGREAACRERVLLRKISSEEYQGRVECLEAALAEQDKIVKAYVGNESVPLELVYAMSSLLGECLPQLPDAGPDAATHPEPNESEPRADL